MIHLTVNGKNKQIAESINLVEYLESLELDGQRVAVAHNGAVVRRGELARVTLSEGDSVEIVRAVGGG